MVPPNGSYRFILLVGPVVTVVAAYYLCCDLPRAVVAGPHETEAVYLAHWSGLSLTLPWCARGHVQLVVSERSLHFGSALADFKDHHTDEQIACGVDAEQY